jgi:hypothetical protein
MFWYFHVYFDEIKETWDEINGGKNGWIFCERKENFFEKEGKG